MRSSDQSKMRLLWFLCAWALLTGCSSKPPPPPPSPAQVRADQYVRKAQKQTLQTNWSAALAQWQKSAEQYRLLNRLPELATALHNVGQAYRHLDEFAQAEETLLRAAELNVQLGRREEWWRNQIALLQLEGAPAAKRTERFEQLRPLSAELKSPELAGQFLNELGLWQESNEPDRSEETFRQAQEKFRQAGNRAGLGTALANEARLREQAKDYAKAADLWKRALAEFEIVGDVRSITDALAGRGRSLAAAGIEVNEAKDLLRRAAANYETLGADEAHAKTTKILEELK